MMYLGKTKIDKTRRISLIKEVADLFEIVEGDNVQFYAEDGKIIIKKQTIKYDGFDFEKEEIEKRIIKKEIEYIDNLTDSRNDPSEEWEERRKAAFEDFQRETKKKQPYKSD